jgi:hypothetical protein
MRDEFASASTSEKMLPGENVLQAALKILGQFVPPMAIAEDDLEILTPVLNVVAQRQMLRSSPIWAKCLYRPTITLRPTAAGGER